MSLLASGTLPKDFYARQPTAVARELLGQVLVRRTRAGLVRGRIVEVEAYLSDGDEACHAARGRTRKNNAMFGQPGHLYVYSIHARYCMNVVTEEKGTPSAVLIRSVEPLSGIPLMQQRRERVALRDLTRGPARLCEAFAVDRNLNRWNLTRGRSIWIEQDTTTALETWELGRSERIGVTSAQHLPLRYFVAGNPYVSGPKWLNDARRPARHRKRLQRP